MESGPACLGSFAASSPEATASPPRAASASRSAAACALAAASASEAAAAARSSRMSWNASNAALPSVRVRICCARYPAIGPSPSLFARSEAVSSMGVGSLPPAAFTRATSAREGHTRVANKSAPAFTRALTHRSVPPSTARIRAVALCSGPLRRSSSALPDAKITPKQRDDSMKAATWRGVLPCLPGSTTSAPKAMSNATD
mmetsp:Transcript_9910/g.38564  ORF Transcript_9910/g.38564 Transcript_9910/m.38564 type:complete len:201 (-) Transcript_9910:538-1140(-)